MEIVAPAGEAKSLLAAINGGADAVYLGIKGFGARRNAINFLPDELCEYIDYAHLRGVKLYLTMNTIMKDNEIEAVYNNLKKLYEAGIDGVIVQDFGFFSFLKRNFPDLEIHASTQMAVKNGLEAEFLRNKGFSRVVPARELSYEAIKAMKKETKAELEIFASGALCVCYSGKCYMSSMIGGKSGNRGMCAQPCRKMYTGEKGKGYFISPKDQMMGKKEIELLKEIGVEAIKIEGRMKSPEYVYETVKYYRDIIDGRSAINKTHKIFNRGYGKGYFYNKTEIINRDFSAHFGYKAGERINGSAQFLLSENIRLGDGISFVTEDFKVVHGEYINKIILPDGRKVSEAGAGTKVIFENENGKYIYKTFDKDVHDTVNRDIESKVKRLAVDGEIVIATGRKLKMKVSVGEVEAVYEGEALVKAEKRVLSEVEISDVVKETGNTSYVFDNLKITNDGEAFVTFKMLKELRREALKSLDEKIISYFRRKIDEDAVYLKKSTNTAQKPIIAALVRNEEQRAGAIAAGCQKIYSDFDNIYGDSADNILVKNISGLQLRQGKPIVIDKSINVSNSYALEYFKNSHNPDVVYLSPELGKDDIKELDHGIVKTGLAVYGRVMTMYIESGTTADFAGKKLTNENGDSYIVRKGERGNTEIYMERVFDIRSAKKYIEEMGIAEVRFDFTFESREETKKIIDEYVNYIPGINYEPMTYERGVY